MKITQRHGNAAFTLIELMAVITIIFVLAGMVVSGMGFVKDRQANEKARVQIALLSKSLEEYKLDMGKYPGTGTSPSSGSGVSEQIYIALFYEGFQATQNTSSTGNSSNPSASKIYLADLDPTASKQGWVKSVATATPPATTKINDPWGNEYRYRQGSTAQNPDFDIWSAGKDGKTNPDSPKDKVNLDDIKNF